MSCDNGRNPMRWDCQLQGCFNRKKRPKIEMLADCLPGRIAFTDVDALTEIGGNLLYLEWKDHRRLATGQRILFQRLTSLCPATVLVVEGDAEAMTVEALAIVWGGTIEPWRSGDLEALRELVRSWADWAKDNPAQRQVPKAR